MEHLKKPTNYLYKLTTSTLVSEQIQQKKLQFGYYKQNSRVAIIKNDSDLIRGLKENPRQSTTSQATFTFFNWLMNSPRLSGGNKPNYVLSTVEQFQFSGSEFHPSHNLFVDSSNSPTKWQEGDARAADQIADLLLPSGQWHRHYDTVVVSSSSNDKQVELLRHYLELTGGSLLIIENDDVPPSPSMQKFINELSLIDVNDKNSAKTEKENNAPQGILVSTYQIKGKNDIEKNTHIISNFSQQNSVITEQTYRTGWNYSGEITFTDSGDWTLYLDTSLLQECATLSIGSRDIHIIPSNEHQAISLGHIDKNGTINFSIKTITETSPPKFDLLYRSGQSPIERIPESAFSYIQSKTDITKTNKNTPSFNPHGFQQVVSLPHSAINSILLTDETLQQSEYFSIVLSSEHQNIILKLDDIALISRSSWPELAQEIENKINHQLSLLSHPLVKVSYKNNQIIIVGEGICISQFQLKRNVPVPYVDVPNTVYKKIEDNAIIQSISIDKDQINNWTHLSLKLTDKDSHITEIYREEFKLTETQFTSPEQFAQYLQDYIHQHIDDSDIRVNWNKKTYQLNITDLQNRKLDLLQFGYQEQILPIVIVENPTSSLDPFIVGAVTGDLPTDENIVEYQLIEKPQFGDVLLDERTGKWQYQPDNHFNHHGVEQFDFVAVMKNGDISAPISVQLQMEAPPLVSIPGKKTFTIQDPIYNEPSPKKHPKPHDMQVHNIQLAQTHLQAPDTPYFCLSANRWALVKVDVTSQSSAKSPDFVAIVSTKEGKELGRVRLVGPERLPQTLLPIPIKMSVPANDLHHQSYTAPLKSEWVQPGVRIRILADNTPILMPYTEENGNFQLNVKPNHSITSHIHTTSLYQQGHGTYTYSPLSWGIEAAARLPIKHFTLYSYPAVSQSPALNPYINGYLTTRILSNPKYDNPKVIPQFTASQIHWAYMNSSKLAKLTSFNFEFHYSAIEPLIPDGAFFWLLGIASPNYGGGLADSGILWHEIYGHGLGLPHTNNKEVYPFKEYSNGVNIAYDQQQQRYITYKRLSVNGDVTEVKPAMYPTSPMELLANNDAFLPHSDYFVAKIQDFLIQKAHQNKYSKHYIQRDTPIYWLHRQFTRMTDGTLHPYSRLNIIKTIASTINAPHDEFITKSLDDDYQDYSFKVTYATHHGLLSETKDIFIFDNQLNLKIADKGELVKLEVKEAGNKDAAKIIFQYKNPESLANRLFSNSNGQTLPEKLQLDNYWRGTKLFWSATEHDLVNAKTGQVNLSRIDKHSKLRASWVENGQLHQQDFSLSDPFGEDEIQLAIHEFKPINHLDIQVDKRFISNRQLNVPSERNLLSDVHIHQLVNIKQLGLTNSEHTYWVTLQLYNEQGRIEEYTPKERWYLSVDQDILTINGTIDSTPGLELVGIKVYIDQHLQDNVAPRSIWLYQNSIDQLAENTAFVNYDRPVEFNSIAEQPALLSTIDQKDNLSLFHGATLPQPTQIVSPLIA
ncbi:hypothetical protein [Providencia rettgeri]|uniref:hypothetical protein n=1 Tax=Providencia rettgeri TaxID=587 RepID=UPI00141A1E46|nr:hypothetical protein [Providencia rettgeri]NIH03359.1 hypothetical protein [Providencia rettgeri]